MAKLTDLPLEEAKDWIAAAKSQGLANILLVAPNTPADRVRKIARATHGFLYYVGITGARTELPTELSQGLNGIKQLTNKPVAVGFGISKPAIDKIYFKLIGIGCSIDFSFRH
ncbi:MAG: tryptophan synthase subunit alpha [Thermodesulfobacteriota bacterium]|nr:tryptophan synthase subunit alpha [Thermodesulfobacteriota bacterium]